MNRNIVTASYTPDAPANFPYILAALGHPSFGPPFGSMTNPSFVPFLFVHRFIAQAEFEVLGLLCTLCHMPVPI